jgi:hypothetical protein
MVFFAIACPFAFTMAHSLRNYRSVNPGITMTALSHAARKQLLTKYAPHFDAGRTAVSYPASGHQRVVPLLRHMTLR